MPLVGKQIKGNRGGVQQDELAIGSYLCRVAQVVELGMQFREKFSKAEGKFVIDDDKQPQVQIMVTYEFTTEFVKDKDGNEDKSKPRWLSEQMYLYPLDIDKATSTKRYNAIDPTCKKGGDWSQLTNAPCMVTIGHKTSGKAKIMQVGPMPKGMTVEKLKNDPKVLTLDQATDEAVTIFESLPEWVRDKVTSSIGFNKTPFGAYYLGVSDEEATSSAGQAVQDDSADSDAETETTEQQSQNETVNASSTTGEEAGNQADEDEDLDW